MIINNKYKVSNIINKGSFGLVANGYKITNNKEVIIKFDTSEINLIKHESFILNYLNSKKVLFIPNVLYYGIYKDNPCLIIPKYDCDLNQLINNNNLSSKQSLIIIKKVFTILLNIHDNFIIHRDLKPDNIMLCNNNVYLIDFGLSCFYLDGDGNHIKNNTISSIIGSFNYCSFNIHNKNTPSRRDDIISVFYIFIFLLFGKLPWSSDTPNFLLRKSHKYLKELLSNHELNSFLISFSNYIFDIEFSQEPFYQNILDSIDNCILNVKTI